MIEKRFILSGVAFVISLIALCVIASCINFCKGNGFVIENDDEENC